MSVLTAVELYWCERLWWGRPRFGRPFVVGRDHEIGMSFVPSSLISAMRVWMICPRLGASVRRFTFGVLAGP
jgi:hypothetical protein